MTLAEQTQDGTMTDLYQGRSARLLLSVRLFFRDGSGPSKKTMVFDGTNVSDPADHCGGMREESEVRRLLCSSIRLRDDTCAAISRLNRDPPRRYAIAGFGSLPEWRGKEDNDGGAIAIGQGPVMMDPVFARYRMAGVEHISGFSTLPAAYDFLRSGADNGILEARDIESERGAVIVSLQAFEELGRLDDAHRKGWLSVLSQMLASDKLTSSQTQ